MSIGTPTDTDYVTTIGTLRDHIGNGTQMSAYEMRLALAVVKNAASRSSTASTAATAGALAATTASTAATDVRTSLLPFDTEAEITLDIPGTAAAVVAAKAALATSATALTASATALTTSSAALPAITYTSSTVADGNAA